MGSVANLKRIVVERLLEMEDHFLVVIDPRCEGVAIPKDLIDAAQPVGLSIGRRLTVPIPDLEVNDEGLCGTLSFNRTPFHCVLPWPCVIQVSAHDEHLVWIGAKHDAPSADDLDQKPKLRVVK